MKIILKSHIQYFMLVFIGLIASCNSTHFHGKNEDMSNLARGAIIEGTAIYRERIAIPPNSVFEAILEDVTIIDAKAIEIGQVSFRPSGGTPIRFSITFNPARIDPTRLYSVRAHILANGRPMFASDRLHPVLTRGAGHTVDILLKMVEHNFNKSMPPESITTCDLQTIGAHGLRLPATFHGDLPCFDCLAIRHHLDLWPDQVFHLRREWVGKNLIRDEVGRWRVDPSRHALILHGGGETKAQFQIRPGNRLRQLDIKGAPIESTLPCELLDEGKFSPIDLSLTLEGEMTYMADAARFTECLTGRSYPVAQEGDFKKIHRAYLKNASNPGAHLYVTFDGSIIHSPRMEGASIERRVVVHRFIDARSNQKCKQYQTDASLTNTYWRITSLDGRPVNPFNSWREPHILFISEDQRQTFAATVGCNQLVGTYTITGKNIAFNNTASTMMACPPILDTLEKYLNDIITRTKQWQLKDNVLEFIDDKGVQIALFEAVYL